MRGDSMYGWTGTLITGHSSDRGIQNVMPIWTWRAFGITKRRR